MYTNRTLLFSCLKLHVYTAIGFTRYTPLNDSVVMSSTAWYLRRFGPGERIALSSLAATAATAESVSEVKWWSATTARAALDTGRVNIALAKLVPAPWTCAVHIV